jgi:3-deoxy-7-phosphoheptulonate synthase
VGRRFPIIAGPCSVESEEQIVLAAHQVREAGGAALRGGAFKPRSSPYSFQGLGRKGLELLALARAETGLAIVTEALDEEGAHHVAEVADCIQIGARNMQNYALLRTIGRLASRAAQARHGGDDRRSADERRVPPRRGQHPGDPLRARHPQLRQCDAQPARSHGDSTRAEAVAPAHRRGPEPRNGLRDKVIPMGRAAIAAGADGLLVEMHPNPDKAMSDGGQSLFPDQLARLVREARAIAEAIGRSIAPPPGTAPSPRG